MGERYSHPTIWEQNIVAFINIYGARAIFTIFYDYQDTEYE